MNEDNFDLSPDPVHPYLIVKHLDEIFKTAQLLEATVLDKIKKMTEEEIIISNSQRTDKARSKKTSEEDGGL